MSRSEGSSKSWNHSMRATGIISSTGWNLAASCPNVAASMRPSTCTVFAACGALRDEGAVDTFPLVGHELAKRRTRVKHGPEHVLIKVLDGVRVQTLTSKRSRCWFAVPRLRLVVKGAHMGSGIRPLWLFQQAVIFQPTECSSRPSQNNNLHGFLASVMSHDHND